MGEINRKKVIEDFESIIAVCGKCSNERHTECGLLCAARKIFLDDSSKCDESCKDYAPPYIYCVLQDVLVVIKSDEQKIEETNSISAKWYGEYHKIKDELAREKAYQRESAKLADKYFVELKKLPGEIFSELRSCVDYIEEQLPEGELPSAFVSLKEDIAALEKKYVGGAE